MIVANLTAIFPLVTMPWWIWAIVIAAMLAVLGVSIFISSRGGPETPPAQPPEQAAKPPVPEPEVHVAPQTAEFDSEHMEVKLPEGEVHVPSRLVETPAPDLVPDEAEAPLPAIEAMGRDRDDLKLVRGITFGAATVLRQAGIQTFAQLAATSVDDLEKILRAAGMRNLDPRSWPEQAGLAAAGDWQGLDQLQKQLSTRT